MTADPARGFVHFLLTSIDPILDTRVICDAGRRTTRALSESVVSGTGQLSEAMRERRLPNR